MLTFDGGALAGGGTLTAGCQKEWFAQRCRYTCCRGAVWMEGEYRLADIVKCFTVPQVKDRVWWCNVRASFIHFVSLNSRILLGSSSRSSAR